MEIEDLSSYDEFVEKGIKKHRVMSTTYRELRRRLKWIGDEVLILYICRKYAEAGQPGGRNRVLLLCQQSEDFRKSGHAERRLIMREALSRFEVQEAV